ncbi:MAG: vWA domain-containing protein [Minicystis sp.]
MLTAPRLLASFALLASLVACGPSSTYGDGDGGAGAGGSDGIQGPSNDIGFTPGMGSGSGSGSSGGLDGCASSSEEATLVPVNMFVTVDKSGSMKDDQKWDNAKAAFIAFFQDPEAASLRVALRFWPDDSCDANTCNANACAKPAVDIGPLSDPTHVQALVDRFNQKSPGGNTPMSAALAGATMWASNYATNVTEGSEKAVVILVTDGEPNGCDEDINHIANEAKDAYDAAGVQTFAVGLAGSNQSSMDKIAASGNTTQGFFIGNGNAKADLIAALKKIQASSVACAYAVPKPAPGKILDPKLVNVNYTPSGQKTPETLGQVPDAASCGTKGGWFYDDPSKPGIIKLCPTTCDMVQGDPGARMEIVIGCTTQPA